MPDPIASRSAPRTPLLLLIPPPVLFAGAFALGLLLQHWLAPRTAIPARVPILIVRTIGISMIAFGAALAFGCLLLFLRAHTTVIPHGQASALVTSGPYRWTRNPMYVALTLLYAGAAVLLRAVGPLFMLPLALAALHAVVIPHEERALAGMFGDEYLAYCQRVRRWL